MIKDYQEIQCDCCGQTFKKGNGALTNINTKPLTLYVIDDDNTGASCDFCSIECMLNYLKENFERDDTFKIYSYTTLIHEDNDNGC